MRVREVRFFSASHVDYKRYCNRARGALKASHPEEEPQTMAPSQRQGRPGANNVSDLVVKAQRFQVLQRFAQFLYLGTQVPFKPLKRLCR